MDQRHSRKADGIPGWVNCATSREHYIPQHIIGIICRIDSSRFIRIRWKTPCQRCCWRVPQFEYGYPSHFYSTNVLAYIHISLIYIYEYISRYASMFCISRPAQARNGSHINVCDRNNVKSASSFRRRRRRRFRDVPLLQIIIDWMLSRWAYQYRSLGRRRRCGCRARSGQGCQSIILSLPRT